MLLVRCSALIVGTASALFAGSDSLLWNHVGYERTGPKTVVAKNSGGAVATTTFQVVDAAGNSVLEGVASDPAVVPGWGSARWKVLDFSSLRDSGRFVLKAGGLSTDTFEVRDGAILRGAGPSVVSFFHSMRSAYADDHAIAYWNQSSRGTHDVRGGWMDATGDDGKYLSHLSYADFMNPQQIPMVVWSLLRSAELAPKFSAAHLSDLRAEAAWGADYLLRVLDPQGYFYINVFREGWSGANPKTICAWIGDSASQGHPTSDYQAAWREGGGMSIAALALAARSRVSGDSSAASYLAGAVRAFDTLSAKPGRWADDGRENLIDHYCALLAAVELFRATGNDRFASAAAARADSIVARQRPDGWLLSDNTARPFYHGVDEGLPLVALWSYLGIDSVSDRADAVRASLSRSILWYRGLTREVENPFVYPRMYAPDAPVSGVGGTSNLALGKVAWASESEGSYSAANAVDGGATTRWSAYHSGLPTALDGFQAWIAVDLGKPSTLTDVSLSWEAAYATQFAIQVAQDTSHWTTVSTVTDATGGLRTYPLPDGTVGRYLRILCQKRALTYGGYSLYEWTVSGAPVAGSQPVAVPSSHRFFMPHRNETGYWWQGENARLGSISAGLLLAGRAVSPQWAIGLDSLSQEGVAGLDWIGGKNSAGVNFVFGVAGGDYPSYSSGTNAVGGICNGITALSDTDQQPVFFANSGLGGAPGYSYWRWIEQWLPHDANYLLGAAAVAHLVENPPDVAVSPRPGAGRGLRTSIVSGRISAFFGAGGDWTLVAPGGRVVARSRSASSFSAAPGRGTWIVQVRSVDGNCHTAVAVVP